MRLITLDEVVDITREMFDNYVEHVGISLMSGEVPSIMFAVHRRGSKEHDWLAEVRFKNTLAISVFRCEVWIDDVFRLCRRCKMFLVTREVYRIAVLYAMLHPLYQSQYINFDKEVNADYDSMMAGAGTATYNFISKHVPIQDPLEKVVLLILRYHMMIFSNHYTGGEPGSYGQSYEDAQLMYQNLMVHRYPAAYYMARFYKAQTCLIDKEGFIIMERRTGNVIIENSEDTDKEDTHGKGEAQDPSKSPGDHETGQDV